VQASSRRQGYLGGQRDDAMIMVLRGAVSVTMYKTGMHASYHECMNE
jgi:hypothetical protein